MPFFDFGKLKIAERLEAMAGDAGKSVKTALTPKAPFPLSISGLADTAAKKLDTTASTTADAAEKAARSKAENLQKATIGKVTDAASSRVSSEVGRVEKQVDDKVTAANKAVDDKIDAVGKRVDGGIASANTSLDEALGRSTKKGTKKGAKGDAKDEAKDAPEPAVAAAPEAKDSLPAPLAAGFTTATPTGRSRSNAVIGAARTTPAAAEAEGSVSDEGKAEPEAAAPEAVPAEADADAVADDVKSEAEPEGNFDEFNESDSGVDVEGEAVAAARERKRAAQAEAEDKDDDLGLAGLFGEENDEDTDEEPAAENDDAEPGAPAAGEADTVGLEPEAEIEQIAAEHEGADGLKAKVRALREKLTTIDNEARALLGGSLATGGSSSENPWLAFFAANAKFKKKKAIRDFKNELEGKKEDEQEKKDGEEAKGAAKLETQEVTFKSGKLHRSEKSPEGKGGAVDTTGKKTGSKDGRQVFVVSTDNKLYMPYAHKDSDDALLSESRTLLDGEMRVKDGKITYLSNDAEGEQESRPEFLDFLQTLRDAGVGNFDVFEASKKQEAKATDLLEEADKADEGVEVEPAPEQAKLLDVMTKNDEWKALIADRTEKLVLAVAEQEGWKVAGDAVVDATGQAVDVTQARTVVDKSRSKVLAKEAAEAVARKAGRPSVDA